jgi:hypothetical protein
MSSWNSPDALPVNLVWQITEPHPARQLLSRQLGRCRTARPSRPCVGSRSITVPAHPQLVRLGLDVPLARMRRDGPCACILGMLVVIDRGAKGRTGGRAVPV